MSPWVIESNDPTKPLPHEGETIHLLTPEEFDKVLDGQSLISIFGEEKIKGIDYIDTDVRFGHMAFGLPTIKL